MKRLLIPLLLLLLPLLLGFSVPAIAHNEANGGCDEHCEEKQDEKRKFPHSDLKEDIFKGLKGEEEAKKTINKKNDKKRINEEAKKRIKEEAKKTINKKANKKTIKKKANK